jgi:transposase-like protein
MPSANSAHLEAGVDYPKDLSEFDRFFPNEEACERFLEYLRWPDGFVCPSCGHTGEAWRSARGLMCPACRRRAYVTAGTIFEKTRKPLKLWFIAAWEIAGHKYGTNAMNLMRMLGLNSYQTAWAWLHKFRRAMVDPDRHQLAGIVEVDETYVGAVVKGGGGRHTGKKAIVSVAVEIVGSRRFGRVRLARIPDVSRRSLEAFVTSAVRPETTVLTDGWRGYNGLRTLGFKHVVFDQSASDEPEHIRMPGVHLVSSLLKRWLLGTYQGGVSNEQLSYYLDEFAFRFNRRKSRSRGLLFYRLLEQAVQTDHISTQALSMNTGRGAH